MKRLLNIVPVLIILAVPVVACTFTAETLLPRLDAALAADDGDARAMDALPVMPPEIQTFELEPGEDIIVGDSITATWASLGGEVQLCLHAERPEGGQQHCYDGLPPAGSLGVRVDTSLTGALSARLTVTSARMGSVEQTVDLGMVCAGRWFTTPVVERCASQPVLETEAAAQPFERGWMLWLRDIGRYFVLADAPVEPGTGRYRLLMTSDPLNVTRDTADSVEAPPGLVAPVSGFGNIWRGDAFGTGYREVLGWGTQPEFAYTALYQCDDDPEAPTCYVTHPDGWVVILHPDGTWSEGETLRAYEFPETGDVASGS
ncbi:MAG: hypothetical protein GX484_10225 [Chloroflexi bacterium]|nr:hypothetical protein [Chloroflexota bacterium]